MVNLISRIVDRAPVVNAAAPIPPPDRAPSTIVAQDMAGNMNPPLNKLKTIWDLWENGVPGLKPLKDWTSNEINGASLDKGNDPQPSASLRR